eukprot:scaffold15894_cov298-Ochromonas_danica.AAC.2
MSHSTTSITSKVKSRVSSTQDLVKQKNKIKGEMPRNGWKAKRNGRSEARTQDLGFIRPTL